MTGSAPRFVVVAGPSGCGKTTVAAAAAEIVDAMFFEADDYHADEARAAMATGIALRDAERRPWIARLTDAVRVADPPRAVIACSALNPVVRDWLSAGLPGHALFAFIDVPRDELSRRLAARRGHFAGTDLLSSQLAALHPGGMIRLDGQDPPTVLARRVAGLFDAD